MKYLLFSAMIFFGFLSAGCSAARKAELEKAAEHYARALQRGDENVILAFVSPSKAEEFDKNMSSLERIQLSAVEIRSINPQENLDSAVVTLFLEYYPQGAASLVSMKRRYFWKYDEKQKRWFLEESTPFGSN